MVKYYNVNGEMVDATTASIKVNDLGIIRGYGIFDYFLTHDNQPLFIDDYIHRFMQSAQKMNLELDVSSETLKDWVYELLQANQVPESGVRLVATGGYTEDGYTPIKPNLMVMQYPFGGYPNQYYTEGVKMITAQFQREVPDIKTTNYAMGIQLIPKIKAAGAIEAIYYDGSFVREAVRSNLFIVTKDKRLITPASNILFGITRRRVLEAAQHILTVEEREVAVQELKEAKEVFVTGSNKKVMPVVAIDDFLVGDGKVGKTTKMIMDLYESQVKEYVEILVSR